MTPDEQIAVIQARARGEKVERISNLAVTGMHCDEEFNFASYDYRIAKPVPKKVKYYGWIDCNCNARLFAGHLAQPGMWTRAPWLDGEVEE
mgnify:FL=1